MCGDVLIIIGKDGVGKIIYELKVFDIVTNFSWCICKEHISIIHKRCVSLELGIDF